MSDRNEEVDGLYQSISWPFPPNEFVRASRLVDDGAMDQEERHAVREVED